MSEHSGTVPKGCTTVAPRVVTDDTGAFLDSVARVPGREELARVGPAG